MATREEVRDLKRIRTYLQDHDLASVVLHTCDGGFRAGDVIAMEDNDALCVCDPCDCTSDACRDLCHAPHRWFRYHGGGVWEADGMFVCAADLLEPIAAHELEVAQRTQAHLPLMREVQMRATAALAASRKIFDANGQNVTAP